MTRKYQMTGCARIGIFLLFFLPTAYFGISYYQGGDPLKEIQSLLEINKTETESISKDRFGIKEKDQLEENSNSKDQEIEQLKKRIIALENEISILRRNADRRKD